MDEIAYRDLQPGEVIQAGDEWQAKDGTGVWTAYHLAMHGLKVLEASKARRPFNITQMNAAIAMQTEVLAEVRADEKRLCEQLDSLRGEYVTLQQQRDQSAHEYRLYREALTTEQAAHKITMANGLQACKDRDEAEQQCQHLRTALEELQRRRDTAAGVDTLTVGEVVENILSALEIAGHALEYLADVGVNEEAGHYSGFGAAIAVVRKIKESTT